MTAIAGIFVCGIFPVAHIVALILANNSNKKIRASGGRLTGESMNKATFIISWIWIGLSVLFWSLIIIIAIAGGFDSGDDDTDFDVDSLRSMGTYLAARFA